MYSLCRLISDCDFFLTENSMHWILAIIWDSEIYILNPLPHQVQFPELEKALTRYI